MPHASYLTPHTSRLIPHASCLMPQASRLIPHTSRLIPHTSYLAPFVGTGTMRIDLWVDRIGTTSCVYAFLCSSTDGSVAYARGERTIVKVDPRSLRPSPWTEPFRARHSALVKSLPAYA